MMIAALLIGFGISAMNAQGYYRQANRPQFSQQARIHQGVRNGQLNRNEARQLNRQQMHNRQLKRMAYADGRITKGERRILRQERMRADRNIRRKKHNCR